MHMENETEIIVGNNVANDQKLVKGTIDVTSIHVESANLQQNIWAKWKNYQDEYYLNDHITIVPHTRFYF